MVKTNIGYKLFRVRNGKLYPLYVYANEEMPIGEWIEAKPGEFGKDENHVKSKLGDLSYRAGFHLNEGVPFVNHIGRKDENGNIVYLFEDQVWCEVEYSALVDYQPLVNEKGRNKHGKVIPRNACMKEVPKDGFYRYRTNSNQVNPWIICGSIKINRILSDAEVYDLCKMKGYDALPRYGGELDVVKYGLIGMLSEYKKGQVG